MILRARTATSARGLRGADRCDDGENAVDERIRAEQNYQATIVAPGHTNARMPKTTAAIPRISSAHQLRASTPTIISKPFRLPRRRDVPGRVAAFHRSTACRSSRCAACAGFGRTARTRRVVTHVSDFVIGDEKSTSVAGVSGSFCSLPTCRRLLAALIRRYSLESDAERRFQLWEPGRRARRAKVANANASRVLTRFIFASLSDAKTGEYPVQQLFGSDAFAYMPQQRRRPLEFARDEVGRFAGRQRFARASSAVDASLTASNSRSDARCGRSRSGQLAPHPIRAMAPRSAAEPAGS